MTAKSLNSRLAEGGFVQVTTMTKSWVYTKKHVGWFYESSDGRMLYVKHGRGNVCLGPVKNPYVSIRTGRYV